MPLEPFDLEFVYDEKIAPLMQQIVAVCTEHKIPVAATFEYATGEFCTTTMGTSRASDHMKKVISLMQPRQSTALAVTESTDADGRTTINVARV